MQAAVRGVGSDAVAGTQKHINKQVLVEGVASGMQAAGRGVGVGRAYSGANMPVSNAHDRQPPYASIPLPQPHPNHCAPLPAPGAHASLPPNNICHQDAPSMPLSSQAKRSRR